MISLFLTRQIPLYLYSYFNITSVVIIWCFIISYDVHLSHCSSKIVVCWVFIIMLWVLSKTECKSIYYHFRCDLESSSFRKLFRNKWICPDFFSWSILFNTAFYFILLFVFHLIQKTNKKLLLPLYCKINSYLLSDYVELIGYVATAVNVVSSNPNFHHEQYAHISPY